MWMTDPEIMCKNHLLGEHRELHMLMGMLKKQTSMKGYLENNLFEPLAIKSRHDELVAEMERRGYNGHKTPLVFNPHGDLSYLGNDILWKVDTKLSTEELLSRCPECRNRYKDLKITETRGGY